MSQTATPALPIVSAHVARQFARRGDLADAQFLYGEIGERMMERLVYIRQQPAAVLDAGCATGRALPGLRARYPAMHYTGLDACEPLLQLARRQHATPPLLARLLRPGRRAGGPTTFVRGDLAATGLAPESQDMVWSNLALHWHPEPHAVLAEWRRLLKVQGLAMFSCLGPGTLRELRDAVVAAGLPTATVPFVDMHDFGDLLLENGFADPVMDQETLTLTYTDPARLLADVRALGGNPVQGRQRGLPGRGWLAALHAALDAQRTPDGVIRLSIEVAYGHAWRAGSHRGAAGETRLPISSIGRAPRPS